MFLEDFTSCWCWNSLPFAAPKLRRNKSLLSRCHLLLRFSCFHFIQLLAISVSIVRISYLPWWYFHFKNGPIKLKAEIQLDCIFRLILILSPTIDTWWSLRLLKKDSYSPDWRRKMYYVYIYLVYGSVFFLLTLSLERITSTQKMRPHTLTNF